MTAPHHRGARYTQTAKQISINANNNPNTVCTCGQTRAQHPPGTNGKPQKWTAGHTIPGSTTWRQWTQTTRPPPPGDWLTPEMSHCNYGDGANQTNTQRHGFDHGI